MRAIPLLAALVLAACSTEFTDQVGGESLPQDTYDSPPGTGQQVPDYAGSGSGSDLDIDEGGFGGDGISDRRSVDHADLHAVAFRTGELAPNGMDGDEDGAAAFPACGGHACGPVPRQSDRADD